MKTIFKALMIVLFLLSHGVFAQSGKGTIHLNDGSTLTGIVKITNSGHVKYWVNKESKKQVLRKERIDIVVLTGKDGELYEYAFRRIYSSVNAPIKVMEVVTKGKITLYKIVTQSTTQTVGAGPNGQMMMGPTFTISNYFVGKEGTKEVERITSRGALFEKNFRKAAMKYFEDCPKLVKLIEDRTYKKRDLEEIVKFYNEKC